MKKGYPVSNGYMGYMPDGKYHLFASEQDYNETYDEETKEEES